MHLRILAAAALAASFAHTAIAAAQVTVLDVDGRRLQPGTDTLAVYVIRGADTTRTGSVIDELRVIAGNDGAAIQRVYVTRDRVLGTGLDSIFDQMRTLAPIRERVSGTLRNGELAFLPGRVDGWMRIASGDSATVEAPLTAGAYNAATFDLILRASDLRPGWEGDVQAFEAESGRVVALMARVTGTERIDGHDCWRVAADFAGSYVTFWIDRDTRQLRQQLMEIAPGVHLLFRSARPVSPPTTRREQRPRRAADRLDPAELKRTGMGDFEQISLTARLVAHMRRFSGLPLAEEIAQRLRARETFDALLRDHDLSPDDLLWYAPVFELRYRSVTAAIRALGATQVLELASGVSLRGLEMTRDPAFTYVETDLPGLTEEKAGLIAELRRDHHLPDLGNLHLVAANALDAGELAAAAERLQPGERTAIVTEGLLLYLSREEMAAVARNVGDLLGRFPGAWITPDFPIRADVGNVSERQRRFRDIIAGATERRMYDNAFADTDELARFLANLGLTEEVRMQADLAPDLVSPGTLGLSDSLVDRLKSRLRLWTVTLA